MKKINILLFLLCGVLVFHTGCESLEENPDFSTADNFFTTPDNMVIGVNGIYDGLGFANEWTNYFHNRYVFECIVGYQVGWEKGPLNFQNGNANASSEYILAYWETCYADINRANAIIESGNKLLATGTSDDELVERVIAEAKFLRAFFYFSLIRYFDDVPFTDTKTTDSQNLPSNENGKRKILDLLEADLSEISDVLPDVYDTDNVGRATKWAAMALLVKVYLQDEKWDEARDVAEDIMTDSGLSLFADFKNNFEVATENTGERIFEAQVSASAAALETNNHHAHFVPADLPNDFGGVGWWWLYPTKDFRMKYDDDDLRIPGTFLESYPTNRLGAKSDGSWPWVTWDASADFSNLNAGLVTPIEGKTADDYTDEELMVGRPHVAKWVELRNTFGSWLVMEKNIVYLRYADVLLGHSEAVNESGTAGTFDAYFGINEVRERAGLDPLSGLSQSELRDAIVEERVLEFAFEQETYPELKRKSTFGGDPDYLGEYIQDFIDSYGVDRELTERDYVLPIPTIELVGNPNVEQNDPWK